MPAKAAPKKSQSAIKRARQSIALTANNKSFRNMLRTLSKKVEKAVADKNAEQAGIALKDAISAAARAAGKGVIHKNTASRKVSRLTKLVNSMRPSEAA